METYPPKIRVFGQFSDNFARNRKSYVIKFESDGRLAQRLERPVYTWTAHIPISLNWRHIPAATNFLSFSILYPISYPKTVLADEARSELLSQNNYARIPERNPGLFRCSAKSQH